MLGWRHRTGDAENEEQEESADQPYIDYDAGKYSPALLQVNDLEPDTLLTDEADDKKRLLFARQQLFKTGKALVRLSFLFACVSFSTFRNMPVSYNAMVTECDVCCCSTMPMMS